MEFAGNKYTYISKNKKDKIKEKSVQNVLNDVASSRIEHHRLGAILVIADVIVNNLPVVHLWRSFLVCLLD